MQPLKFRNGLVISSHTSWWCNYLSMLGLKLIHITKRGHWKLWYGWATICLKIMGVIYSLKPLQTMHKKCGDLCCCGHRLRTQTSVCISNTPDWKPLLLSVICCLTERIPETLFQDNTLKTLEYWKQKLPCFYKLVSYQIWKSIEWQWIFFYSVQFVEKIF